MKHSDYMRRRAEADALIDAAHASNKQRTAEVDKLYEAANVAEKALFADSHVEMPVSPRAVVSIRADHISLVVFGPTIPNRFQEEQLPLQHVTIQELVAAAIAKARHLAWLAGDIDEMSSAIDTAYIAQICAMVLRAALTSKGDR